MQTRNSSPKVAPKQPRDLTEAWLTRQFDQAGLTYTSNEENYIFTIDPIKSRLSQAKGPATPSPGLLPNLDQIKIGKHNNGRIKTITFPTAWTNGWAREEEELEARLNTISMLNGFDPEYVISEQGDEITISIATTSADYGPALLKGLISDLMPTQNAQQISALDRLRPFLTVTATNAAANYLQSKTDNPILHLDLCENNHKRDITIPKTIFNDYVEKSIREMQIFTQPLIEHFKINASENMIIADENLLQGRCSKNDINFKKVTTAKSRNQKLYAISTSGNHAFALCVDFEKKTLFVANPGGMDENSDIIKAWKTATKCNTVVNVITKPLSRLRGEDLPLDNICTLDAIVLAVELAERSELTAGCMNSFQLNTTDCVEQAMRVQNAPLQVTTHYNPHEKAASSVPTPTIARLPTTKTQVYTTSYQNSLDEAYEKWKTETLAGYVEVINLSLTDSVLDQKACGSYARQIADNTLLLWETAQNNPTMLGEISFELYNFLQKIPLQDYPENKELFTQALQPYLGDFYQSQINTTSGSRSVPDTVAAASVAVAAPAARSTRQAAPAERKTTWEQFQEAGKSTVKINSNNLKNLKLLLQQEINQKHGFSGTLGRTFFSSSATADIDRNKLAFYKLLLKAINSYGNSLTLVADLQACVRYAIDKLDGLSSPGVTLTNILKANIDLANISLSNIQEDTFSRTMHTMSTQGTGVISLFNALGIALQLGDDYGTQLHQTAQTSPRVDWR